MEKMIEVKNLVFEYEKNAKTINDISFDIQKGTYATILGHNGSGKSTIAKLLMGLLEKKSGSIKVGNIELNEENLNQVRSQIGIVFQNPDNQFIGATVRDDIAFGLENMCVDPKEMDNIINEYAKKVNMIDFLDHEPSKLSGGQKQRVAIAGILAMSPSIIILDEATSMLDPRGRNEINALVHQLNKDKNMTILSITHDIEEAALSDEVILLSDGHIIDQGKPEDVLMKQSQIEKLSLDVPFAFKVSKALQEKGIRIEKQINQEKVGERIMSITFKEVEHTYSPNTPFAYHALKGVNLDIPKGSMTALIGHTGSGKSTLIQHINALLLPTSGIVHIDDVMISATDKPETLKDLRKKAGLVFQFPEYQLFEETILKDIIFGPKNFGVDEEQAIEIAKETLKLVGLNESYLEKSPFDLSGGQKRRVAIAGILAMNPDILILDEPTAGLDPQGAKEMLNLFKRINQQGKTVIIVSHDMNQVLEYCDDVVVMNKGKVEKHVPVSELFKETDYLSSLSIDLPTITSFILELNKVGFNIDPTIKDINVLIEQIGGQL